MDSSSFTKSPTKEFPLYDVAYADLEDNKKKTIKKLLYVFAFYSSKSSKHSFQELHENYFMEMMADIWKNGGK